MKILDTERLSLRTMQLDDAPFYLELINEPSWIANISDKGIRTVEAARASLLDGPVAAQAQHGFSFYVVQRQADGVPMGICGLVKRDSLKDVDLGYAFLARYTGHGYAQEAASAVVQYAQNVLRLPKLAAITSPENQRSKRVLQKLGFMLEAVVVLEGEQRTTHLYAYPIAPL